MKIQQHFFTGSQWKNVFTTPRFDPQLAQLVLVFGEPGLLTGSDWLAYVKNLFPSASIVSSSTAGEILSDEVYDQSIVVTAIQFEKTSIRCSVTNIDRHSNSYETGRRLVEQLMAEDLRSVLVISDGMKINGSELVAGLNENSIHCVPVTGGLAGDGDRFNKTVVGLNQAPEEGMVAAIGFYGNSLKIGHGSFGGWDEFGPERVITRSDKNVLYEIDGKNAWELYQEYLGPFKNELPGSALLFPLSLTEPGSQKHLVRTILSINEQERSMTFAGNMPEGSRVRLMKANFDRLIDGAAVAAHNSFTSIPGSSPELAILISCVGRKLVLQDRTDEEVEAARKVFGINTPVTGFYSYGEISPFTPNARCELHNQTMTITTFSERN